MRGKHRRSVRRAFRRSAILALIVPLLAMLLVGPITSPASADSSFYPVGTSGTGLTLDGEPWWPAGVNAYELATDWSVNLGCGDMVDLDSFFAGLPAHSLVRFDAYQAMAVNRYTGLYDPSAIDAVFAAAAKYNQYVLPVLSGEDGSCDNGVWKDISWYNGGWETTISGGSSAPNIMSFESWVTTAVSRWDTSPALAGWELVGEPEASSCGDTDCTWNNRTCPSESDAATALRSFMDSAGAEVRDTDPDHPIFAGFLGGGQCGTAYTDYAYVGGSSYVDVLEYHDYDTSTALPGDQWNGLAFHIGQAQTLSKPLLIAEIGENAGSCEDLDTRASDLSSIIGAQQTAGTAGVLAWDWVPDPRNDDCTYDIGPDDPLLDVLADYNEFG